MHYRGASGIILVYDITNKISFQNLRKWFTNLENFADESAIKILVGNKLDLNSERVVEFDEAKVFITKKLFSSYLSFLFKINIFLNLVIS
jgi:GTPase SAR1 family protein